MKFKDIVEFECIDISNLTEKEFKELKKVEDGFLIRYRIEKDGMVATLYKGNETDKRYKCIKEVLHHE